MIQAADQAGDVRDIKDAALDPHQELQWAAVAKTGEDRIAGLKASRAQHAAKMQIVDAAEKLAAEPVQAFKQAVWRQDTGIVYLRELAKYAPDSMPKVGRAYIDQLFEQATREGGFAKARTILNQWHELGPESKRLLFPDGRLRASLDNFFKGAEMVAHNVDPSGTALVQHATSVNPLRWLGGYAGSKILYDPRGIELLTKAMQPGLPTQAVKELTAQAAYVSRAKKAASDFWRDETGTQNPPKGNPEVGPHGPIFREFYHDAPGAVKKLMNAKAGEAIGALHHPSIGDIDLVWWEAGHPWTRNDKGYGLAHIIAKHGKEFDVNRLQELLDGMTPLPKQTQPDRLELQSKKYHATVRLDWDGKGKRWLLTTFDHTIPPSAKGRSLVPGTP